MSKPKAALRAAGWVTVGVVAAGGVATAATTSDSSTSKTATTVSAPAPAPTAHAAKGKGGKHKGGLARLQGRLLHGQFTVLGKDGKPVSYAEQRGTVSSVSPTSITLVNAKDNNFTQTYAVDSTTRVRVDGKKSTIGDVKTGEPAVVLAKNENGTLTATIVIERAPKAKTAG